MSQETESTESANSHDGLLHIYRLRAPGSDQYYEPSADLRRVLANIMVAVADRMEAEYAASGDLAQGSDAEYIAGCVRVFEIRIIEDPTGLDELVTGFMEALSKADPKVQSEYMVRLVTALMLSYALFMRRDAVADRSTLMDIIDRASQHQLLARLSPETAEAVRRELQLSDGYLEATGLSSMSPVFCPEDSGMCLDRARQLAAEVVNAPRSASWDEMARLCDEELQAHYAERSKEERAALALAYPTYSNGVAALLPKEE